MAGTGWKQPELCRKTGNDFEWLEVLLQMVGNGQNFQKIVGNGWKWHELAGKD